MAEVDDNFNEGNAIELKKSKDADLNDGNAKCSCDTLTTFFSFFSR